MKVNTIMDKHAAVAPMPAASVAQPAPARIAETVEPPAVEAPSVDPVMFPASDRFKHMMSLIARDNKELYNRIVGLD